MATKSSAAPGLALWLVLAGIVILADQVTKTLIPGIFQLGDVRPVTDFFNLVRVHNTGAAFSFWPAPRAGSGGSSWGWAWPPRCSSMWMLKSPDAKLFCFAVSMIMGGALGNVIDRLLHGYVVDFLQFRFAVLEPVFHGGYFPAFNIADSAITLGAGCLILDEILRVRPRALNRRQAAPAPERPRDACTDADRNPGHRA
ncbi:MAG: signal peptidase II [Betaproteobacteria bacterium]|nr:signal peptidase II [Betaproteobacteria bacterium]